MALLTKCILLPPSPGDGLRVSVMSRHTLNDGVTPDARIGRDAYDSHWKVLAPPPKLIGDYRRRGLSWDGFAARFAEHLQEQAAQAALFRLSRLAVDGDVTLLCIEDGPEKCHRRLLAEACSWLQPELAVRIG